MKVIGAAIVTLLAAAAVNLLIDPLAIFFPVRLAGINEYKPEILNYWRTGLPLRARLLAPESVVLGSSRVLAGIDAGDRFFAEAKAFNLGLPGASLCDIRDAYEVATAGGRLARVVIGLDFFAANARAMEPGCGLSRAKDSPWRTLLALQFSSDTLSASLKTIAKQRRVDPAIWQPTPSGTARLHPDHARKLGGARAMFARTEFVYAKDFYLAPPACDFRLGGIADSTETRGHLAELLRSAHARRVEVVMFFSPEHARMYELIRQMGLWSHYTGWIRAVAALNEAEASRARRAPFALHTPVDARWVTEALPPAGDEHRNLAWFIDSSHYSPALGSEILRRISAPQPETEERALASIPPIVDGYFKARPEEREEIARTVAATRSLCAGPPQPVR